MHTTVSYAGHDQVKKMGIGLIFSFVAKLNEK
jgi:hypothetical protein